GREAELVAGGARRLRHAAVGLAMRVPDQGQRSTDNRLERLPAVVHRSAKRLVVEGRQEVMLPGVEPDLETRPGQHLDLTRTQGAGRLFQVRMKFGRHSVTSLTR